MPTALEIQLTPDQRRALEAVRDHNAKAYVREKAAALLKIAAGWSARQVAQVGLLKRRKHQTVSGWVQRYQAEGIPGLYVKGGRGRKPAFSPSIPDGKPGASGVAPRGAP